MQIGLFKVMMPKKGSEQVQFKNNKRSALLREGHPNCLKHMVSVSTVSSLWGPMQCANRSICL